MKIIVTGGAGFIGSNFLHGLASQNSKMEILCVDSLTYAGSLQNIDSLINSQQIRFFQNDINSKEFWKEHLAGTQYLINFAAESHVDRSIEHSSPFLHSNTMGVHTILEALRNWSPETRLLQVSTDEVYGSLDQSGSFTEESNLQPSSPYSASKAAGDLLALSYFKTYGLDCVVTRSSNNYGPYQFPEKLIPVCIQAALNDQPIPIYGSGENVRDWIHVQDNCRALWTVLTKGTKGEVYNIGGGNECANIALVKNILKILDKPESLIEMVTDRLGHDFRYSVDSSKVRSELHWQPEINFEDGLKKTVDWYIKNQGWIESVRTIAN